MPTAVIEQRLGRIEQAVAEEAGHGPRKAGPANRRLVPRDFLGVRCHDYLRCDRIPVGRLVPRSQALPAEPGNEKPVARRWGE